MDDWGWLAPVLAGIAAAGVVVEWCRRLREGCVLKRQLRSWNTESEGLVKELLVLAAGNTSGSPFALSADMRPAGYYVNVLTEHGCLYPTEKSYELGHITPKGRRAMRWLRCQG